MGNTGGAQKCEKLKNRKAWLSGWSFGPRLGQWEVQLVVTGRAVGGLGFVGRLAVTRWCRPGTEALGIGTFGADRRSCRCLVFGAGQE